MEQANQIKAEILRADGTPQEKERATSYLEAGHYSCEIAGKSAQDAAEELVWRAENDLAFDAHCAEQVGPPAYWETSY
jgi:hypothetical protein